MNTPVTVLKPGTIYRVALWLPEPKAGDGAKLFEARPDWPSKLAYWLRQNGANVSSVVVHYGPVSWGPRGYYYALNGYAQMYAMDLEFTGSGEFPVADLENAFAATLDSVVALGPIAVRSENPVYKHEVPTPKEIVGEIVDRIEGRIEDVAALALLALLVVLVSRFWPLGGMALLAALLIMALGNEGGVHAQA